MLATLTPQQVLAMGYARLRGLSDDLDDDEPTGLEVLSAEFNRALDDLHIAGFDLSAFSLDGVMQDVDLRGRLDAVIRYMDLLAGLP